MSYSRSWKRERNFPRATQGSPPRPAGAGETKSWVRCGVQAEAPDFPRGPLTRTRACAHSIFLIDHAWTCRVEHARQQLQQVPGLLHRMANLMGVEFHGELPSAEAVDLVLEEMWKFNQTYQLAHGVSGPQGQARPPVPGPSGLAGGGRLPKGAVTSSSGATGAALVPWGSVMGLFLFPCGRHRWGLHPRGLRAWGLLLSQTPGCGLSASFLVPSGSITLLKALMGEFLLCLSRLHTQLRDP